MRADFAVVLDACVLAEAAVSDLFLRLSEEPRLLLPRWTPEIWQETHRTWVNKLGWPVSVADSRWKAATEAFPEAMVTGYGHLLDSCQNHLEDRHVLASAIHCGASTIVTFNTKHYPPEALDPWEIMATHPSHYLRVLYDHDPAVVTNALHAMAGKAKRSVPEMLARLAWYVRPFSEHVANAQGLSLPEIRPRDWRRP